MDDSTERKKEIFHCPPALMTIDWMVRSASAVHDHIDQGAINLAEEVEMKLQLPNDIYVFLSCDV